jgi:hypothetical protein
MCLQESKQKSCVGLQGEVGGEERQGKKTIYSRHRHDEI